MTSVGTAREPYVSPLQRLAFLSLLLYLFVLHSRVLDLTLPFLHIPVISLYAAVAAAFLGGGVARAFANRIGFMLLLLTAWMMMCIPFSVWPGGAATTVKDWLKTVLVFLVIAGLVSTFDQFRRAIHILAYSILVLALMANVFGDMKQGRLVLSRGRFTNPNDLAQILLMGLPFWWYVAMNPNLKPSRRVLAYLAMIPIFMAMSKTGSRGALIAALVVGLVLFWRSSMSRKVLIMAGVVVLVVLSAVLLPSTIKERYFTFFEMNDAPPTSKLESDIENSAVSSTFGRWLLFKDSVVLTMLHPLFGVGAGQFDVAQDQYSWAVRNHKGAWQVTHNTFTEFSCENGIPALLFYCLAFFFTFKATGLPKSVRKNKSPKSLEYRSASFCLQLSLLSYLVSSMFGSFAYQTQFPVLAGLALVFSRTMRRELASSVQAPGKPMPIVTISRTAHPVIRAGAGARA
jgi:O-antigen ligase